MSNELQSVYHAVVFVIIFGSLVYNLNYIKKTPDETIFNYRGYGGKFKYLTFWTFLLQTFYFGLACINDILGSNVRPSQDALFKRSKLQKFRDIVFSSLMYPIGIFVVTTFWGIYAVDRELVYPKALDKLIPTWMNHIMHTTILPFLVIEMYLVYIHYPSRATGFKVLMCFAGAYQAWTFWIAYSTNFWVYPILQQMQPHERTVFIFVLLALMFSIYLVGEGLNKFFWGREKGIYRRNIQAQKKKN